MLRLPALGLVALAFALPTQAQEAPRPTAGSTYVVPGMPGEAVRVTVYARRPPERGRLARRYRGLRANRSPRAVARVVRARPVARTVASPRHAFVRLGGSYYQVVPRR